MTARRTATELASCRTLRLRRNTMLRITMKPCERASTRDDRMQHGERQFDLAAFATLVGEHERSERDHDPLDQSAVCSNSVNISNSRIHSDSSLILSNVGNKRSVRSLRISTPTARNADARAFALSSA